MPSILFAVTSRPWRTSSFLLLAAALLFAGVDARAQSEARRDSTASLRTPRANVYTAGPTLRISAPVEGDLFAAGGQVVVERPIARDAALAGGDIGVSAPIG